MSIFKILSKFVLWSDLQGLSFDLTIAQLPTLELHFHLFYFYIYLFSDMPPPISMS